MSILDIPKIKEDMAKRHKVFLDDFGNYVDKVISDDKRNIEKVRAKLIPIVNVLASENIVETPSEDLYVGLVDFTCDGLILRRNWTSDPKCNYVRILTNGKDIVVMGSRFKSVTGISDPVKHHFIDVLNETFDWVKFSKCLLAIIHENLYEREEAANARIDGMLIKDEILDTIEEGKQIE